MPRKSAAALSVVAGQIDHRPEPPDDLTEFQKDLWKRVVAGEPADFIKTAALQQILREFCRHAETAQVIAGAIDGFKPEWLATEEGLDRYAELLKLRDREVKGVLATATKLRITNQARYTTQAAGTASKKAGQERKPWEAQKGA